MAEWIRNEYAQNYTMSSKDADFFVSYLPGKESDKTGFGMSWASDGMQDETALVSKGEFSILNGDWRPQYEAVFPDWDACVKVFDDNKKDHKSSWSTVH